MSNRLFSVSCPVTHCAPSRVRRTWGRTVLDVLMMLVLAALCAWLWSCVKAVTVPSSSIFVPCSGRLLAMAPVNEGMVIGMVMSLSVVGIVLAVRKARETDAFCRRVRRLVEAGAKDYELADNGGYVAPIAAKRGQGELLYGPMESIGEPETEMLSPPQCELTERDLRTVAMGMEDLRRNVEALTIETCLARDYLLKMERLMDEDDREDLQRLALSWPHLRDSLQRHGEGAEGAEKGKEGC